MTLPDLSVLKKLAEARLISLLETESGDKDVIIDGRIIRLFDFVASITTLKRHGVNKVYRLESSMINVATKNLIYIIRPDITNLKMISEKISCDKRNNADTSYKIIFTPCKFYACEVYLEQEGIYGDVKIEVLDLELIPMDKDLLSFEVPAMFSSYFTHRDRSWIKSIAQSLVSAKLLFGEFNRIYTIGNYSKKIWNLAEILTRNADADADSNSGTESLDTRIDTLIMIDRDVDFISPLLTQVTYQGIIDDTFGIENGYLVLGPTNNIGKGSIKMLLNSSDQVFADIRDSHITTVFSTIRGRAKEIQSGYDKRHEYKSVSGLKDFVRNEFKDLQSQHKSLTGHLSLCENLMTTKTKENLEYLLTQESNMLTGTDEKDCLDFIENCILDKDVISALRLMCLYSVTHDGLPPVQYNSLWLQLLQSHGYDKLVATQYALKKAGLFKEQTSKKNKFKAISKKLGLIPKSPTEVELVKPNNMAYIHGGRYAPMSCKLVEHVLTFPNSFREDDEFQKLLNCDCSCTINPTISATQKNPLVMVYFIGGCTYSEIAALRFLGKQLNTEILIATTSVISSKRLLTDVLDSA